MLEKILLASQQLFSFWEEVGAVSKQVPPCFGFKNHINIRFSRDSPNEIGEAYVGSPQKNVDSPDGVGGTGRVTAAPW